MFKLKVLMFSILMSMIGVGLAIHVTANKAGVMRPIAVKIMSDRGLGTAWAYRGYIITAAHVCQDAKDMDIIINDHAELTHVLAIDKRADICVLSPTKDMPLELKQGKEEGTITQYGFAGMDLSISSSKLVRFLAERSVIGIFGSMMLGDVQPIYVHVYKRLSGINKPGMSGGPAVNSKGEVVGLLTGGDGVSIVMLASLGNLDTIIDSL